MSIPNALIRLLQAGARVERAIAKEVEDALMSDDKKAQAVEYIGTYLALKSQIAALEDRADEARSAVREILDTNVSKPGDKWVFEGLGKVEIVKGRVSEKLDRARLARAGVAAEVLDAATVRTEGEPSMRITADKGGADAAA